MKDQNEALRELEGKIGFGVRGFAPGTVAVPEQLQISIEKLHEYFKSLLGLHSDGGWREWGKGRGLVEWVGNIWDEV